MGYFDLIIVRSGWQPATSVYADACALLMTSSRSEGTRNPPPTKLKLLTAWVPKGKALKTQRTTRWLKHCDSSLSHITMTHHRAYDAVAKANRWNNNRKAKGEEGKEMRTRGKKEGGVCGLGWGKKKIT